MPVGNKFGHAVTAFEADFSLRHRHQLPLRRPSADINATVIVNEGAYRTGVRPQINTFGSN